MKHRLLVVLAGGLILLTTVVCGGWVPRTGPATPACIPIPMSTPVLHSSAASLRWYDGSTLVYVPAGAFPMGVTGGEDNPLHQVLLDDFWIYKTEVTNGMYGVCVAAGACTAPGPEPALPDYTDPTLKDNPVVGVTWAQADMYCSWVNGRLPTEAQWEKAAAGTDGRPFPWGQELPDCDRINFQHCVDKLTNVIDYQDAASPYGGLDFSGNAAEWVADWYKATYYAESPAENPPGPATGQVRAVRGGSFASSTDEVRVAMRSSADPLVVRADLGFRCVVLDAQSYSAACEIPSRIGLSYTPRHGPGSDSPEGKPTCDPPPINVTSEGYCQKKVAYVNINPNGAKLAFTADSTCHQEGDLYACTGDSDSSFTIKACSSCMPPTAEVVTEPPSCPANYKLDDAKCACRFVGAAGLCTKCPSAFSAVYVPAQECCQAQAQPEPQRLNLSRAAPSCDPGYVEFGCTCIGWLATVPEKVTKCEEVSVTLPTCGGHTGEGCAEQACSSPASWDATQCCCAVRGKCK